MYEMIRRQNRAVKRLLVGIIFILLILFLSLSKFSLGWAQRSKNAKSSNPKSYNEEVGKKEIENVNQLDDDYIPEKSNKFIISDDERNDQSDDESNDKGDDQSDDKGDDKDFKDRKFLFQGGKDGFSSATRKDYFKAAKIIRNTVIPVIVFGCSRVTISRCLDALLKYRHNTRKFPIYVSLDCDREDVRKVVSSYEGRGVGLWIVPKDIHLATVVPSHHSHFTGYYKISAHYKWALGNAFNANKFDQIILLEDDMEISPDFFGYFEETLPLLYADPSLFCISSWNDQGKSDFVNDPKKLLRSDFFPGLGWLMHRSLFQNLYPIWPEAFWDDWLRHPDRRKDRSCIIPEISRTRNFGRDGVSQGQFFDEHISKIASIDETTKVDWTQERDSISRLVQTVYDQEYGSLVYEKSMELKIASKEYLTLKSNINDYDYDYGGTNNSHHFSSYRISYSSKSDFNSIVANFGLMDDTKAGVPRSAYHGIIQFKWLKKITIFIAPLLEIESRIYKILD